MTKTQAFLISFIVLLAACTKIDYTRIGADLIPVVDNINTFDTILEVQSFNYIPADSSRMFISDPHAAGAIENDPLFGTSRSALFFEMKPATFPFAGFGPQDSIAGFDSAVLVLNYRGYYGDSASPVNFKLYEVDQKMQYDSLVLPHYTFNPALGANTGKLWGQKTMEPRRFRDTVPIKRGDSVYARVTNQLRIRLNQQLAAGLFYQAYDTTTGTFRSDSLYKEYLPGFALVPEGSANALLYFGLQDAATKLEFYYRVKIVGRTDTTSQGFTINSRSAHAIKFERNRSGAEINSYLTADPQKGAPQVYVQTAPGTAVSIKIPGIAQLSNRVIHRAELRVTELSPNNGPQSQLTAPPLLYLDAADQDNVYRGIPYDLNPFSNYFCFPNTAIEYFYFGGPTKPERVNGETLNVYRFNMARYLQGVITRKEPVFNFRLSAPYYMVYEKCSNPNFSVPNTYFFLRNPNNSIADLPGNGRIRLAGGSHPDPNKRMQLRVIYSKL